MSRQAPATRAGDAARRDQQPPSAARPQSTAEWATLGLSVAIVLAVVALVTYQYLTGGGETPVVNARPLLEDARRQGDRYYLPVAVANSGDLTAQDVRVQVALAPRDGAAPETAEFTLAYLAGGATKTGTVTFRGDPAQGEVRIESVSFVEP